MYRCFPVSFDKCLRAPSFVLYGIDFQQQKFVIFILFEGRDKTCSKKEKPVFY